MIFIILLIKPLSSMTLAVRYFGIQVVTTAGVSPERTLDGGDDELT
jgi:hypothetical protein